MKLFKSLVMACLFNTSLHAAVYVDHLKEGAKRVQAMRIDKGVEVFKEIPKKYKEWQEETKLLEEIESYAKLSNISYDSNIDNEYANNQALQRLGVISKNMSLKNTVADTQYVRFDNVQLEDGLYGSAYCKNCGESAEEVVIAFRGTEFDNLKDLKADIEQLWKKPEQYKNALIFANKILQNRSKSNIHITGHSLGGGLAQYTAASLGLPATTFNAAGLFAPTRDQEITSFWSENIKNITYGGDLVSEFGTLIGPEIILNKDNGAILKVLDNHSMDTMLGYIKERKNADFWKQKKYTKFESDSIEKIINDSPNAISAMIEESIKIAKELKRINDVSRLNYKSENDLLSDLNDHFKEKLAESAEENTAQYGYSASLGTIDGGNYLANNQIKTVDVLNNKKFQMLNAETDHYDGDYLPLNIDDDYAPDEYKYTVWGDWGNTSYSFQSGGSTINVNVADDHGVWVTGTRTKSADIPTTGSAVYAGQTEGFTSNGVDVDGLISLTANFATSKVDATVSAVGTGFNQSRTFNDIDLTRNNGHNRAKYYQSNADGYINGTFYGPNAEEAGGKWKINNGSEVAKGVFYAKQ